MRVRKIQKPREQSFSSLGFHRPLSDLFLSVRGKRNDSHFFARKSVMTYIFIRQNLFYDSVWYVGMLVGIVFQYAENHAITPFSKQTIPTIPTIPIFRKKNKTKKYSLLFPYVLLLLLYNIIFIFFGIVGMVIGRNQGI